MIAGAGATSSPAKDRLYCYQKVIEPGATGGGLVHINGFAIEVKPVADSDVSGGAICQATIRSPEGKTVFDQNEWGMEIDPVTGKDVNGDGHPDAVIVGYSGGAHCCWTYYIVSLGQNSSVIAQFENRSTAAFEVLKEDGRVEILIRDGTFDEGFGQMHPFSPFPLLIVRLKGSRFEDVGAQFWPVFEREIRRERGKLKATNLDEFRRSNPFEHHDSLDYLDTKYRVLAITLGYLYAGKATEARGTLRELWPAEHQERAWHEMLDGYCSGLRAQLKLGTSAVCKGR